MSKVEIFDPAMCCSTGVCGPGVDPELLRVATIINSLQKAGKEVIRHNLSDEPDVYVKNKKINEILMSQGVDALPITMVDGEVVLTGTYPSNEQLVSWTGASMEELVETMIKEEIEKSSCCGDAGGCCGEQTADCCDSGSSSKCCGE